MDPATPVQQPSGIFWRTGLTPESNMTQHQPPVETVETGSSGSIHSAGSAHNAGSVGAVPTTPGGAPMMCLTSEQFMQLVKGAHRAPTLLPKPRCGGTDTTGTWTGRGIDQRGTDPSTKWARRQFIGDPLKRFQLETAITQHIQRGLNGMGGSHFAMAGEANSDKALIQHPLASTVCC